MEGESEVGEAVGYARCAVGYARVSTGQQAEDGVSLDAQEAAIRRYAELRGLVLQEVVVDRAVSGSIPLEERPGGSRLLTILAVRQFEPGKRQPARPAVPHLIAVKLDRLFRSSADMHHRIGAWNEAGLTLHLVDQGGSSFSTRDTMGKFMLSILAALAEMERDLTIDRTRAARELQRERGERLGTLPFGYTVADDGKTLIEDPAEQAAVARIHQLRGQGHSVRGITELLNAEGVPARGSRWHKTRVGEILKRGEGEGDGDARGVDARG